MYLHHTYCIILEPVTHMHPWYRSPRGSPLYHSLIRHTATLLSSIRHRWSPNLTPTPSCMHSSRNIPAHSIRLTTNRRSPPTNHRQCVTHNSRQCSHGLCPPCQALTHPFVSERRFLLCVALRSISESTSCVIMSRVRVNVLQIYYDHDHLFTTLSASIPSCPWCAFLRCASASSRRCVAARKSSVVISSSCNARRLALRHRRHSAAACAR